MAEARPGSSLPRNHHRRRRRPWPRPGCLSFLRPPLAASFFAVFWVMLGRQHISEKSMCLRYLGRQLVAESVPQRPQRGLTKMAQMMGKWVLFIKKGFFDVCVIIFSLDRQYFFYLENGSKMMIIRRFEGVSRGRTVALLSCSH